MKAKIGTLVVAFLLLAGFSAFAQNVSGKVTDSKGQPLPGVSVFFKGTSSGVSTDAKGSYSIMNKSGAKSVVFSCLGMKEQEIVIGNKSVINVTMEEDVNFLDETVVIGYQTVQRKDLMGAVASVDSKTVTSMPTTNFAEALSGKMAGVNVTTTEGDPDAPVQIRVRGIASITQDSSPLYIVDGFPVNGIADLNPQDIKSIDVLKDGFSTAIYGSRGAYGVVLITTKDAASGKVSLTYDGYVGIKRMANRNAVQVMGPYEYARYLYEFAALNNDKNPGEIGNTAGEYIQYLGQFSDMEMYRNMKGNDWLGKVFDNTGITRNHNVQLSGSTSKGRWNASYAHMDEDAIMLASKYVRDNLSIRGFSNPTNKLAFSAAFRFSNTEITGAGSNSINDKGTTYGNGRLMNALRFTPIPMDYNEDIDGFGEDPKQFGVNPLKDISDNDDHRVRQNWTINGSATWTIIPNLKLRTEASMDNSSDVRDRFYGLASYYTRYSGIKIPGKPNSIYSNGVGRTLRNTNTLSYNFKELFKNKKHNLDMLIGQEYSYSTASEETVETQGFPEFYDADMARRYRATAEDITASNNYFSENDVMLSFFGRANYVYDKRYSLSAAIRADASSKFSKQNRLGIFPSAAASWDIANEPFLKHVRAVNQLKLRYSFGSAGNNRIPSGNIRTKFSAAQKTNVYGMENVIMPSSVMPNENLKWETTYSHNLGLDFAFFRSRLSGTVELYNNTTKDLLINYPVTGVGYNSQYRNLGSVNNRGIELTLRGVIVEKKNFGLNVSGNVSFNRNKVLSLGDVESIKSESGVVYAIGWDYLVEKGEPLGNIYAFQSDGWYTVDDLNFDAKGKATVKEGVPYYSSAFFWTNTYGPDGAPKSVDQNGDGQIDANDKVKVGNALPIATGGFNIAMNFYGFDLNAAFNFSYGNDIINGNELMLAYHGQYDYRNLALSSTPGMGKAWTRIDWNTGERITDPAILAEVNKNATKPTAMSEGSVFTDRFVEDGSFLRLSSLTLGYTLPARISQIIKSKKVRIYATGSNLFCLTKYSGFDPEVNCRRNTPLTPGVDCSAYPKSRSIIAGLNITF